MNELERARQHKKSWNRFLEAQHRALEHRQSGQLSRLLAGISPTSESATWELAWLEQEDRYNAQNGLVELKNPDGQIEYKYIDDLSRKDLGAMIEAQRVRFAWIRSAHRSWSFSGDGDKEEAEEASGRAQGNENQSPELPPQILDGAGIVVDAPGGTILRLRDDGADSKELRAGSGEHGDGISHATADGEGGVGKVLVGYFAKQRTGSQGV